MGCFKVIPAAHAIHLKPTPIVIELLDRRIEDMILEIKPLERYLGRTDLKVLGELKSMLKTYSQDHPDAIKNSEVIQWLSGIQPVR